MGFFNRNKKEEKFAEDTFVIVGLGNPGKEYEKTRHNMGFRALDVLASDASIDVRRSKFHALIGQGRIAGRKVILVKPQTYMNNSGIAVREAAMFYNVPSCNVIVIYDDIDLPAAAIRVRKGGGPGTHNGMKSVVQQLGVKDFPRVRIGVGAAEADEDLVERVIGKVSKSEQEILDKAAVEAAAAVEDIVRLGIDIAMNRHNHKPAKPEKKAAKQPAPEQTDAARSSVADKPAPEQTDTAPTGAEGASDQSAQQTASEPEKESHDN